jgi:hypothetical protein
MVGMYVSSLSVNKKLNAFQNRTAKVKGFPVIPIFWEIKNENYPVLRSRSLKMKIKNLKIYPF